MAEKIQCRALGGENAARRPVDRRNASRPARPWRRRLSRRATRLRDRSVRSSARRGRGRRRRPPDARRASGFGTGVGGDDRVGRQIARSAEILEQSGADERLDHDPQAGPRHRSHAYATASGGRSRAASNASARSISRRQREIASRCGKSCAIMRAAAFLAAQSRDDDHQADERGIARRAIASRERIKLGSRAAERLAVAQDARGARRGSAAPDPLRYAARPARCAQRAAAQLRVALMLAAVKPAQTTASSSELLARRLAP